MALISVVVPVYHNAETLPRLVDRLSAMAGGLPDDAFEFVFVDDGSGDASFEILTRLVASDARLRLIRLSRNFGSNAAVLAGLTFARGNCAVVISADLQDPPEMIPRLAALWREGHEIVMAARRHRSDPPIAKMFAVVFNRLFRRLVFPEYPKDGFDFMLVDRRVIDLLVALNEKNSYLFGQALWLGFRRAVVYYDREARAGGRSRWTTAKKIKYFIDAFTAFSYVPLRAASVLGMALATLGFLYAALVVAVRLIHGAPVAGWASLTVIVLVASGTQLIVLGVLGEYLWRILDETRRRPPFIVDGLVNCDPAEARTPLRGEGRPGG